MGTGSLGILQEPELLKVWIKLTDKEKIAILNTLLSYPISSKDRNELLRIKLLEVKINENTMDGSIINNYWNISNNT